MRREKETATFVTGQQLGLLGGPLYTTYKVLGAVYHAEQKNGRAVYWLETNDADFNEINQIHFIDSGRKLRTLKWDIDSRGFSSGYIPVDKKLVLMLEEFFDFITQTEFTPGLKQIVMDCYTAGRSLGEASYLLAGKLFGGFDLELFDPSTKEFREFSFPILYREAENTPEGEQCNLFYMDGKKRTALFKRDGGFVNRANDVLDLRNLELVPSLKSRSICQDAYFLTDGYIAGPGEVKYLSELEPNYKFHSVEQADVIPRMSVDLVEPAVKRVLRKLDLDISDIDNMDKDEMLNLSIKKISGFDKKELFKRTDFLVDNLVSELNEMDLQADKLGKDLRKYIKELIGRKRRSDKEKCESVIRQIEMLYVYLRPFGEKQERVFNLFYYMNLYGGIDLINNIYKRYDDSLNIMEMENG